jgi:hypothetical protein
MAATQAICAGIGGCSENGGSQGQEGPKSETLANDNEAKHSTEKGPEEVVAKQNKAQDEETKIKANAVASFQLQPNWIVRFGKPNHPFSLGSVQKGALKSTTPETALAPRWCPLGLMHSQRWRIQWMRAQKLREEAAKKERDRHFNTIRPMFLMKKEWRVKEKTNTPMLMDSNDDMDLLDDDEAPLINDRPPPLIGIGMNMLFMLPAEFRGVEEEVVQMCLSPKEVVLKKPE